jgi:hypothetical protein
MSAMGIFANQQGRTALSLIRELRVWHPSYWEVTPLINRFFHLTTVVLLASCFVLAQTKSEYTKSAAARRAAEIGTGKWWIGLTDEARNKFIERYTKAMDHVMNDLATECSQGMRSLLEGEKPRSVWTR